MMKYVSVLVMAICFWPRPADALQLTRRAEAGVTTSMWQYGSWNANCESVAGVVKVISKPSHGKLTPHRVNSIVHGNARGNTASCMGRPFKAFQVDYRSEPGFRGVDTFSIDVTFGNGRHDVDSYVVNVH